MKIVGCTDIYRINALILEKLFIISINISIGEVIILKILCPLLDNIAKCNDFYSVIIEIFLKVSTFTDSAVTDNSNAPFCHS